MLSIQFYLSTNRASLFRLSACFIFGFLLGLLCRICMILSFCQQVWKALNAQDIPRLILFLNCLQMYVIGYPIQESANYVILSIQLQCMVIFHFNFPTDGTI